MFKKESSLDLIPVSKDVEEIEKRGQSEVEKQP